MVRGIIVTGACIAALMAGIKEHRLLRVSGLTATCSVAERFQDGSEIDACRSGRLEGLPNLTQRGCTNAGLNGTYEYWRCPAAQATGP
jgi:hypothetical protein